MKPKADVLIITATEVESRAVMQIFKEATGKDSKPTPIGDRVYHDLGQVNGASVFMALSEMGSGGLGGSQQAVRKGIRALKPKSVIMVGIAFGINQEKQAIGDILVSQQLWLYDLQRVGADRIIPRGDKPHASTTLINWFQGADLYWNGAKVRFGLVLTGEKLVDNVDYRDQLKQFEPEAIGGEMEGAGLYVACQDSKVDWILVKAICDWADGHKNEDKGKNQQLAARNAASYVLHTIQQSLPRSERELSPSDTPALLSSPSPVIDFPIFGVPYRHNLNFTGREPIITDLHRNLSVAGATVIPQVITGLGGIGKTQIAVEYAYRYSSEYDLVWWMRANEAATLSADYLALATKLQLPVKTSAEQRVFANIVRHWLESAPQRWLIVFDNVENPEDITELLPKRSNGNILITSRNPDWRSHARVLPTIRQFTPEEARDFLFKRTGQQDQAAADKLVELLGGLPLALEQAGAFISKLGLSLGAYIQLYEKQRQDLWQRETPPLDYKATVTTTWELAFQRVRDSSPGSIALLNLCIFLAPDEIPLSIFKTDKAYLPTELAEAVENSLRFEEAVSALYHYSLIERKGENLSIHRLVQEVARDRLGPDKATRWIEASVNLMNHVFPFDKYDMTTWPMSAPLLPHALAVVIHAEQYSAALEQTATLWQRTGMYLRQHGEYARAQVSIEHALRIRTQLFGADHELVAESLDYLGELYQEQGKYAEASKCHHQALANRQRSLGQQHADTALSLNNLGLVANAQGKYEQAREYFEAALAIRKQVLGEQHPDTASSINNLGGVFQAQGKYEQAREYFEEALAIKKYILGEQHPDTASSINNLGGVFQAQGKYEQAREYHEATLAIRKQVLGEQHPDTACSINDLGGVFQAQGKYEQAREYFEAALAIDKQVLGEQHPDTATSLNNLGFQYRTFFKPT